MNTLLNLIAAIVRLIVGQFFRLFIAGALVLFAGVFLAGCSGKASADPKTGKSAQRPPVPVLVGKAVRKNMLVQVHAIGNVMPLAKVSVRSRITGQLTRAHFQEGQEVKRGDLLFTIDPRPSFAALHQAEADLARDQAQLDSARRQDEREKKLLDENLVSRDEYDKLHATFVALQATVLADKAAISNATLNVEFTSIRSPIDGRTGNLLLQEGNIIKSEDDVLVTINQIRPIFVSFGIPEQELPAIKRHMQEEKLAVTASGPDPALPQSTGELTFIDNAVDTTTGTIQLKATFPNDDNALWPGQFVQVAMTLTAQPNAIVVPSQAIQTGQNGQFVFVVKADSTVEMRPVLEGMTRDGETVVESGLQPGETVVTDGQLRLVPGSRVKVSSPNDQEQSASARTNTP